MPRSTPPGSFWLGLMVVTLASGGYGVWRHFAREARTGDAPPSGLEFEPNAEQRQKLEQLRARLSQSSPRFAPEDARQKANAKLFTYMAGTSEEPLVVEASLDAIQSAYSSRSSRKEAPDADLDRVLLKHLRSSRSGAASAAFRAARIPLMTEQPGAELISGLAELARTAEAPRRLAALEALDLIRPDNRGPEVLETFESALSAREAELVSTALFALAQSEPSLRLEREQAPRRLGSRLLALTGHSDPGVRGRALAALAELDGIAEAEAKSTQAAKLLADGHPYVRAQAADALARLGATWAIHRLIELVEDVSPAFYELTGWTALDGHAGRLVHELPGRKRVAEAALYAIQSLGASTEQAGGAFELSLGRSQNEGALRENAERAKAWYARARASLPPAP
jgi:hypothetical protein